MALPRFPALCFALLCVLTNPLVGIASISRAGGLHRRHVRPSPCGPFSPSWKGSRRILYNLNHAKLVSNEVPLLLSLGYEVYVPKKMPENLNEAISAGISTRFDSSLTIPKRDLMLLNAHNFYDERTWSKRVAEVIENNFCLVITAAFETPISTFLSYTSLPVGIRVFGLEANLTYSDAFSPETKQLILEQQSRCVFLSAFTQLALVETDFKDMFRFAPVACEPTGPYHVRDVNHRAVLFQCSRININPYYTHKAKKFIADFSDSGLDYSIYGTELSSFNDSHNLGRPTSREINLLFATYSAMYYDSMEPRHLHFHPVEAMYAQMPVVFLQQSMLESLMPYSPAKSKDVREAKKKLLRLVLGDRKLEEEIIWHQNALLQTLKTSNIMEDWRGVLRELGCG